MIGSSFYISDSTNSEVHPAGSGNKSRKSGIIKSLKNTIKLNDLYKVKQFGGFFKIFWEIFKNYRIIGKNTEYQDGWEGRSPFYPLMAAKLQEASGKAKNFEDGLLQI